MLTQKKRNDDTQQNDSLSDTDSGTGKLVIDEKCMQNENGDEREKEWENVIEILSDRSNKDSANVNESLSVSASDSILTNSKSFTLSSNEVINASKSSTSPSMGMLIIPNILVKF